MNNIKQAQEVLADLPIDSTVNEILYHIKNRSELDNSIEYGKLLAEKPIQENQSGGILDDILGFITPIFFIGLFLLGIPFGYKVVMGSKTDSIYSEKIVELSVSNLSPEKITNLLSENAKITDDYLIIETENEVVLISEENISHLRLLKHND